MAFAKFMMVCLLLSLVLCINADKDKDKNKEDKHKNKNSACIKNAHDDYQMCKRFCGELGAKYYQRMCQQDCQEFFKLEMKDCVEKK